jgi:histidinol-phosphatase (PHP family)
MLADYHVHTSFSDDSDTPMEDAVKRAIELGLTEICFTEHVDYGVKTDLNCRYDEYFPALHRRRRVYGDRIVSRKGSEFGVQRHTVEQFEADFRRYDFDFVILSNHQIDDKEFWRYEYQPGKTQEEYQTEYYQAIYDVMRVYKNYSVLGHLDMIKRYDPAGEYPDEKILPMVSQIFKQAIADGKGIEVNTSSFKYGIEDLTPSKKILKLYHDMGGEILTIGSDAHDTDRIADHFDDVKTVLRDMGFTRICTFKNMKPIFHKL